eukprot:442231_1
MSHKAPLPLPPKVKVGDHVKLLHGTTGIVQYIGSSKFSDDEIIGIKLDTYDPTATDGTHDGIKHFSVRNGRGYFTTKQHISNIILTNNNSINKKNKLRIKQVKEKLRKIGIWECKYKNGVSLNSFQLSEINNKQKYLELSKLKEQQSCERTIHNDWNHTMEFRTKMSILCRITKQYWTGQYMLPPVDDKHIIQVNIDDAVRVSNGGTGIIKYIGPINYLFACGKNHINILDEMNKNVDLLLYGFVHKFNVPLDIIHLYGKYIYGNMNHEYNELIIGINMDQWHPSYCDGTIDGIRYFDSDDGRGYYAHPWEIVETFDRL